MTGEPWASARLSQLLCVCPRLFTHPLFRPEAAARAAEACLEPLSSCGSLQPSRVLESEAGNATALAQLIYLSVNKGLVRARVRARGVVEARPDLGPPELQANAKAALYLSPAHIHTLKAGRAGAGRWGHHLVSVATGPRQVLLGAL